MPLSPNNINSIVDGLIAREIITIDDLMHFTDPDNGELLAQVLTFTEQGEEDPAGSITIVRSGTHDFGRSAITEIIVVCDGHLTFGEKTYKPRQIVHMPADSRLVFRVPSQQPLVTFTIWKEPFQKLMQMLRREARVLTEGEFSRSQIACMAIARCLGSKIQQLAESGALQVSLPMLTRTPEGTTLKAITRLSQWIKEREEEEAA